MTVAAASRYTIRSEPLRATGAVRSFSGARDGTGAPMAPIGPGRAITLRLAGSNGIPTNATAIVLNLAAARVQARSFVSVWPAGEPDPGTSNLNVVPGRVSANLVICRLGTDGAVTIANPVSGCDVIGDVMGYFV